jgi:hypothetical protein
MTTLVNNFEGITPSGTTLTAGAGGNTGGVSGSFFDTITIVAGGTLASDSTHAAHGNLGVKVATGGTAGGSSCSWTTSLTGSTIPTVWFREYLYFTANPAAQHRVFAALAAAVCGSINISTAGKVVAQNAAGTAVLTSTASIPLNQWFRIEGFITGDAAVGQIEFKLFTTALDSATADETQTSAANLNTNAAITRAAFGITGTSIANAGPYWIDDAGASDAGYLGPVASPPGPGTARPGKTWLRRFHHQQQQPPVSVITAAVSGPPVYPLGHPIQAKQYPPLQGGRTSNRRGVFAQAGPPVRMWDGPVASVQPRVPPPRGRVTGQRGVYGQAGPPVRIWTGPVQARPPLGRGGHVATRTGFYGQTGPPVRQWDSPVRAPIPAPVRGGRVASRDGVFAQAGPQVRQWHAPVGVGRQQLPQPVRGRIVTRAGTFVTVVTGAGPPVYPLGHPVQAKRWPTRGGSVTTRDGVFDQAGPPVRQWDGPVQARQPLPARGRTSNRSGTFTFVATGQGPPVYPLGHPVQAKRLPIRGGQNASRDGTFDQQGPAVRQWDGPVQARQPLPPRGRAQGRAGTFTFVATGQGPPIYPLGHPVQAKRQPLTGGRVVRRAGTFAQAGPPARVWHAPAGVGRQQPPPPTRGRTGSQRGPYAQTGPKVRPLQGPVRARLPGPYRSGRSDSTLLPAFATPPPLISVATGTATVSDPRSGITSVADPRSGIPSVAEAATGITSATDPRSGIATVADPRDGPGGSVG